MNWDNLLLWSLTGAAARGIFAAALLLGVGLAVLALTRRTTPRGAVRTGAAARRRGLRGLRRPAAVAAVSAAVTGAAWLAVEVVWRPFAGATPAVVYLVWGIVVFTAGAFAVAVAGRTARGWAAVAVTAALLGAAGVTNVVFQQYPTLRSLDPQPTSKTMTYAEFAAARHAPRINGREVGALVTVDLPADNGFTPRPAVAWIPPAYFHTSRPHLPVLVLMAGNPGRPEQWFTSGAAGETADAFQATHNGLAPIVVSVDATGSLTGNPACTGAARDYVTRSAPGAIAARFRVDPDRSHWTVGGLSYGGTCALQVVTNTPQAFGTFLDFSGQAEPTLGTHRETVDRLFGGDEAAFAAENPADLLARNRFDGIAGRFIVGREDTDSAEALRGLNRAAGAAGMDTVYEELPGSHSFEVWRVALRDSFAFAAQRGGLQ